MNDRENRYHGSRLLLQVGLVLMLAFGHIVPFGTSAHAAQLPMTQDYLNSSAAIFHPDAAPSRYAKSKTCFALDASWDGGALWML